MDTRIQSIYTFTLLHSQVIVTLRIQPGIMKRLAPLLIIALMTALGWHTQRTGSQFDPLVSISPATSPPPPPISMFYMAPADFPPNVRLDLVHPFENMPIFPEINATYKVEGMRVPNIVHYTFFTPEDDVQREEPLHFLHYLGIRSSIEVLDPDVMMLWVQLRFCGLG